MKSGDRFSFAPAPDGNSVTVTFSGCEGVACRFDRVEGDWTVHAFPEGVSIDEAQLLFAEWRKKHDRA